MSGSSAATKKTGKYIQSVLEQLERELGIHAMVLVTYKDEGGDVKISEYVPSRFDSTDPNACKALRLREYLSATGLNPPIMMR